MFRACPGVSILNCLTRTGATSVNLSQNRARVRWRRRPAHRLRHVGVGVRGRLLPVKLALHRRDVDDEPPAAVAPTPTAASVKSSQASVKPTTRIAGCGDEHPMHTHAAAAPGSCLCRGSALGGALSPPASPSSGAAERNSGLSFEQSTNGASCADADARPVST
jgi:hypothetical protein